jgi:hypothetical protein
MRIKYLGHGLLPKREARYNLSNPHGHLKACAGFDQSMLEIETLLRLSYVNPYTSHLIFSPDTTVACPRWRVIYQTAMKKMTVACRVSLDLHDVTVQDPWRAFVDSPTCVILLAMLSENSDHKFSTIEFSDGFKSHSSGIADVRQYSGCMAARKLKY